MKTLILRVLLTIGLMELSACSIFAKNKTEPKLSKVLIASGYGQLPEQSRLNPIPNKITAEQTAKLNAYRELARQLYSESLTDGVTLADQVIKSESFRTYLDLYLREAKVKESISFFNQKKIVLELSLSPRFYHCISTTVDVVSQCLKEDNKVSFTRVGYQQVPTTTINFDCVSSGCATQLSMSGFSKKKNLVDSAMLEHGLYDSEWSINMALKSVFRYFVITKTYF